MQKTHMKIITPLTNLHCNSAPQVINIDTDSVLNSSFSSKCIICLMMSNMALNVFLKEDHSFSDMVENTGSLRVQALYDFTPGEY